MKALAAVAVSCLLSAPAWGGHRPPPAPPVSGVVNVNTATQAQLELLPGVGASRAKAIIAYRSDTPFAKVDDLKKVKGVGKGIFERIHAHVAVSGPNTLAKIHGQGQGRAPPPTPES